MISDEGSPPKPICLSWALEEGGEIKGGLASNLDSGIFLPIEGRVVPRGDGVLILAEFFLKRAVFEGDILILANAKFDLLVLHRHYPQLRPLIYEALAKKRIYDVQIIEKLLELSTIGNIGRRHNLAFLILKYLKIDITKDKVGSNVPRLNYGKYDFSPSKDWEKAFVDYAVNDSILTLRVFLEQKRKMQPSGFSSAGTHEDLVKMDFSLGLMTQEGLEVDQERAILLKDKLDDFIGPLRQELIDLGFAKNLYKDVERVEGLLERKRESLIKLKEKGDVEKIQKAEERIEAYLKRIEDYRLHNANERKVYRFDSKKFREYLVSYYPTFVTYGKRTKTGQRNVKIDVFALATFPPDPIIEARKNLTLYEKYRSTYIPMFFDKGRIHPRYNLPKNTGRTSSIIHLWPRDGGIRSVIKADEGYKFLVIDYSGLELCTFSQVCYELFGYSKLGDWLNSGESPPDAHGLVTYALYADDNPNSVPFEEFITWKNHEDPSKREVYKAYRAPAKEVGLGYPGGRGHESIYKKMNLLGINISEEEALNQRKVHAEAMPEIIDFLGTRKAFGPRFRGIKGWVQKQYIGSEGGEDCFAYDSGGRYRNNSTFCATANGKGMQSPASNGAIEAVFNLTRECYDPSLDSILLGSKPCWFIHDEVGIKVPVGSLNDELIKKTHFILIEAMQEIAKYVRITTEGGVMKYWEKDESSWERVDKFFKDPSFSTKTRISKKSALWR